MGADHERGGMVVSPHYVASRAGMEILRDGGGAVEAAVATAACLCVVYPHMNSLGGDGFWLIAEPHEAPIGIESCGAAAAAASLELYRAHGLNAIPWRGPLAANTVAGMVAGWAAALVTVPRPRLPLARLLAPAIACARDGIVAADGLADTLAEKAAELAPCPGFAHAFLPGGAAPARGAVVRQPRLAETLERLAHDGLDDFYQGGIAADLALDLEELGAPVALQDLQTHRARRVQPLSLDLGGDRLFNLPPPTQGVASLVILALFERLGVSAADGFEHLHGLVEATKQAFRIRDRHVGDPAYAEGFDPQALLGDEALLDRLAAEIDPRRARPWPDAAVGGDTVWFGVIDQRGAAVSSIQSTYFEFGSGLVLPRTGVIWQNRGAGFRLAESGWNALKPGRKPFHTLNPAMARLKDGRLMSYGTMGGEGQPQTQAAVFTRYARFGQDLEQAISAPRWLLGRTWGEDSTSLKIECGFPEGVVAALEAAGHVVELVPATNSMMGHAGALVRWPDGQLEGASDPRCDGEAATWRPA